MGVLGEARQSISGWRARVCLPVGRRLRPGAVCCWRVRPYARGIMTRTKRILYYCPDNNLPSGGGQAIYRRVGVLNANGFRAVVVHSKVGFGVTWFPVEVPVLYAPQVMLSPVEDIVVLPEVLASDVLVNMQGVRKVILNQGYFMTFSGGMFDKLDEKTPYRHPDVIGTIVNSRAAAEFLEHAFGDIQLHRVRLSIDPALFRFEQAKKCQIAVMSRRGAHDALQIFSVLKYRGVLRTVDLAPIDQVPQSEAARMLRESLFFLSLGSQEGFGLPAAEALACGCIVVGYHGFGGREYFRPEFSFPIEPGDVLSAARTLEGVIAEYRESATRLDSMRQRGAEFVRGNYSPAQEARELLEAWTAILGRA
jgi:hypothetical protein